MKSAAIALMLFFCLGNVAEAKSLEENVTFCEDCHGKGGVSKESDIPTIAGFSDVAYTDILKAYKDGTRQAISSKFRTGDTSRPETNMNEIAKKLTPEEIKQLAQHFSAKNFVPVLGNDIILS